MDVAQVDGTDQLISIKTWAMMPTEQRPGPMTCPGQDDDGTPCTTEAIPCAYSASHLRGEKSRRPYWRGKKHLEGCDEGTWKLQQQARPVDSDETSLVGPRKPIAAIRIKLVAKPQDTRVPTTPASIRHPSNGGGSRSQVDTQHQSEGPTISTLLQLLNTLITDIYLRPDTPVTIPDKNGQLINGPMHHMVARAEKFSRKSDGTPMVIWGIVGSIRRGNADGLFINFETPMLSLLLERNANRQLTEKQRQNLVKGAYVIAVGITETTKDASRQLLRVNTAVLLAARNLAV